MSESNPVGLAVPDDTLYIALDVLEQDEEIYHGKCKLAIVAVIPDDEDNITWSRTLWEAE
jgi:hypothetical protein